VVGSRATSAGDFQTCWQKAPRCGEGPFPFSASDLLPAPLHACLCVLLRYTGGCGRGTSQGRRHRLTPLYSCTGSGSGLAGGRRADAGHDREPGQHVHRRPPGSGVAGRCGSQHAAGGGGVHRRAVASAGTGSGVDFRYPLPLVGPLAVDRTGRSSCSWPRLHPSGQSGCPWPLGSGLPSAWA
jgi:hypothetical protein